MNFQIFKILSFLGYLLVNINLLFLIKKKNLNIFFIKKILFKNFFKLKICFFFFYICVKYIKYGNIFVRYYLLYYFNIHSLKINKNYKKKKKIKKKNKLINIIKINNFKIFKIYSKIKKNLIRKYSINLTRKIVERNSLQKLLKSILL